MDARTNSWRMGKVNLLIKGYGPKKKKNNEDKIAQKKSDTTFCWILIYDFKLKGHDVWKGRYFYFLPPPL